MKQTPGVWSRQLSYHDKASLFYGNLQNSYIFKHSMLGGSYLEKLKLLLCSRAFVMSQCWQSKYQIGIHLRNIDESTVGRNPW